MFNWFPNLNLDGRLLVSFLSLAFALFVFLLGERRQRRNRKQMEKVQQQGVELKQQSEKLIEKNEELKGILGLDRERFSWEEVYNACRELAAELRKFKPDFIITTPGAPMIVTGLVIEEFLEWSPVLIIPVSAPDVENSPSEFETEQYERFHGIGKTWHIPKTILQRTTAKIAVIDDACTGTTVYFDRLLEMFKDHNFQRDQIFTACLFVSSTINRYNENFKLLDWSWFKVSKATYYLPWGKETEIEHKN